MAQNKSLLSTHLRVKRQCPERKSLGTQEIKRDVASLPRTALSKEGGERVVSGNHTKTQGPTECAGRS